MPLLDGKYEILRERALGGGVTRFDATAPDGVPVVVDWLDLEGPDEPAFERYRRLLKGLAREGRAAIQDVVGRPGARYVAWYLPPENAPAAQDADLAAAIRAAGFDPEAADVRRSAGAARLFALPFRPVATSVAPVVPPSHEPAAQTGGWRTWPWRARAWTWATGLGLVAAALALAGFATRSNDRVVVVPDVVGWTYTAAARELHELGLDVEQVVVATLDTPPEQVVSTEPAAHATLRPGRPVRVTLALPPGTVAPTVVPRLVGASRSEGEALLAEGGLAQGRVLGVHAAAPVDVVLAQTPPAGATVGRGALVDVVASLGPEPERTFVPDLIGRSLEEARSLAELAGLEPDQVIVERLEAERVARDTVLSQSLAAYHTVDRASAVLRLVVADPVAAAASTGLPALGGLDVARAREFASGFDVQLAYVSDSTLPDGVVGQSLPVGATPADGTLVLTVNARPVRIPRPTVTALVRRPEPRAVPFLWFVEPGIPPVTAEITATTLEGETFLVERRSVQGGERVEGRWRTMYPGVVRFDLTLNGEPYGGPLLVP